MADQVVEKWSLDLSTEEAQKSISEFGDRLTKSFTLASISVKALEKGLELVTSAFRTGWAEMMETQAATIRLNAAVKAFGATSGATSDQLVQLAERMSRLTGYESDQLVTLQSTMLMYGVASNKIEAYTRASVELANVTGGDLASAFMRLQRMEATGNVDRTMKTIPGLNALTKAQIENGEAVDVINEKWGQFIGLRMEGLPGEINKLTLAWKDMSEAFVSLSISGGVLSGVLSGITELMRAQQKLLEDPEFRSYIMHLLTMGQLGEVPSGERFIKGVPRGIKGVQGKSGITGVAPRTIKGVAPEGEIGLVGIPSSGGKKGKSGGSTWNNDIAQRNADIIAGIGGTDYGPGQEMAIGMASDETDARFAFNERLNERRMKAEELLTNHLRDQAEARKAILAAEGEAQSEAVREWGDTIQTGVGLGLNALEELVLRGKDAAWRFVVTQLGAIGQRLFMKGMADVAEGFAISANPLTPGLGAPLVAAGLKEMAVGGGLAAGALVAQATSGSFDQGGGGGGGGGGGAAFAGSAGVGGQREPESAQPQPITVILQGPVYDGAAAGVAIAEKIAEARKQGLLK